MFSPTLGWLDQPQTFYAFFVHRDVGSGKACCAVLSCYRRISLTFPSLACRWWIFHAHTRGIYCFYFFLSFRSFTQRLTSFDPKFLPSIQKSPALEKKSGLVILSSEMEQKVSKCGFHEPLVSQIGLWASVCKVHLATH